MQLGLSLTTMYPAGTSAVAIVREQVEMVRAARDCGFGCISIGQHFLSYPEVFLQPIPLLARLAAESGDMTLLTSVLLLPLYQPADLAEQVATLNAICGDRFILGVGLGYRTEEFASLGVPASQRLGRFLEAIQVLRLLFGQETVTFHGRYFQLQEARMTIRPERPGGVPIWIGAGTPQGLERAARLGDGLCLGGGFVPLGQLEQKVRAYRSATAASARPDASGVFVRRQLVLHPDRSTALAATRTVLERTASVYQGWGFGGALFPDEGRGGGRLEADDDHVVLAGNPSDVARQLERYADRLDPTYLSLSLRWPGLDVPQGLQTIRLLGEQVLPRLR